MTIHRCWARIILVLWFSASLAAPTSPAPPSSAGLRLLAEGSRALEEGHLPRAIQALTDARSAVPALRDYASFFLAKAEFQAHHYAESASASEQVAVLQPPSPLAARAAVLGARAYLESNEPRKALTLLARVEENSLPLPEAGMVRAHALESEGSARDAALNYQLVYCRYPRSPEAQDAAAALDRLRSALGAGYPETPVALRLERADGLREAGELAAARQEYAAIAADFTGASRELALVRAAAAPYYAGNAGSAMSALDALGRQAGEVEAERLYSIALCERRLDRDDSLDATLATLSATAPGSPWRLRAFVNASNLFLIKDDARQEPIFTACAASFPDAPEAPMCHWRAAWWAYRHHNAGAAQFLRQHLKLYPTSEKAGAAVFYLGRLAEKSGDGAAALAWNRFLARRYPNYYYTFVARPVLQRLEPQPLQPSRAVEEFLAGIAFPERPQRADFNPDAATARRIERARLLDQAGLDNWAENELRFAVRTDAQPWPAALELAEMATRNGAPDRAMRHIKGVLPNYLFLPRDGAPLRFWRLAFPLPYRDLLKKYARANGLDPFLVAALIRQESEFNPKAISVSRAVGLMQILPSSGRELARKAKLRGFRTSMLTQPETNIRLGTFYFRHLLDSCAGRVEDALASYNAGHSRVVLWRGWGGFEDASEFVETIPFTQTRDYVQIVLRNAELYRWLYASEAASPAASSRGSASRAKTAARRPS
ncbi:MAG: transglycosylase SLT domain-containing protein [Bryobacteraceae bacterium]